MIKIMLFVCIAALSLFVSTSVQAEVPAKTAAAQQALLASPNPTLAKNKRLAYNFMREVFYGCHPELADKFLSKSYVQHNPNVPSGRAGFVRFLSHYCKSKPIAPLIKQPIISIVAEGNMVVIAYARKLPDPKDSSKIYMRTWFDMFRIANGKIVEHWDPALKR